MNDRRRIIITLGNRAEVKFGSGDVSGAIEDVSEGIAIAREIDAELDETALSCANMAAYCLAIDDRMQAWVHARDALQSAIRLEAHRTMNFALQHLAHVAALQGQLESAARILGRVDAYFTRKPMPWETTESVGYERMIAILRAGLAEDELSALMEQGAACDESAIIEEAMTIPQPETPRAAATSSGSAVSGEV